MVRTLLPIAQSSLIRVILFPIKKKKIKLFLFLDEVLMNLFIKLIFVIFLIRLFGLVKQSHICVGLLLICCISFDVFYFGYFSYPFNKVSFLIKKIFS